MDREQLIIDEHLDNESRDHYDDEPELTEEEIEAQRGDFLYDQMNERGD